MTVETYKKLAADLRSHMEEPFGLSDGHCVLANKESLYLPGGEKRSVRVRLPVPEEDLSHLNSPNWKKHHAAGKRNVRRKKR